MHVLLTGGSGFIATHVLHVLLDRGHTIVTTLRTQDKAQKIKDAHPTLGKNKLDFAIVPDIAVPQAFDAAVQSNPPFDAVIHTASPLSMSITDVQKEVLDPAIQGTTGLLASIKRFAPSVKRVVVLSSLAAMVDFSKGDWPSHRYTADDWNPITHEEALQDAVNGYRGSKTFAEQAAWAFMKHEKPAFSLTTLNPPFVFGPVMQHLSSLEVLNNSNKRFVALLNGMLLPTTFYCWIDVRDVALGHVKAMEDESTAGERIFFTSGEQYCNKDILQILDEEFPEFQQRLPDRASWEKVGYPAGGVYKIDANRARKVLGKDFISLRQSVVDTVKWLREIGI
ncbi:ketoreductase [Polyplosphaeria fusca]|uniref:Ketoreductase n=1 Tax=Polyplosphaeria fusca TaxID=682080 RepID=A0A9P4UVF6_9PLEO|nr:ketoreductase [Polyplosphaeria fusca]